MNTQQITPLQLVCTRHVESLQSYAYQGKSLVGLDSSDGISVAFDPYEEEWFISRFSSNYTQGQLDELLDKFLQRDSKGRMLPFDLEQ